MAAGFLHKTYIPGILCTLCLCHSVLAYEDTPRVSLAEILAPELAQSLRHRVTDVQVRRGVYQFSLESDIGRYQVATTGMVRERIREILILGNAVSQYAGQSESAPRLNRGQLEIRSDRALDILSQPVSSATNLAGQLADNLDETLSGPPRDEARRLIYEGGESSDPVVALHKRNIASQWQVDVYSTNPGVQNFLNSMARARSAGSISAGTPALNRQPVKAPRIADAVLDTELSLLLKNKGPAVLNEANERLLSGLGIGPETRTAFLQHAVFSPRHKTRISNYLNRLAGVANLSAVIDSANHIKDESEALAWEHLVMMLAYYHQNGNRMLEILPADPGGRPHVSVITDASRLLCFVIQDLIYWNKSTEKRYTSIQQQARVAGADTWMLITSGTLSRAASEGLRGLRFDLQEQSLF